MSPEIPPHNSEALVSALPIYHDETLHFSYVLIPKNACSTVLMAFYPLYFNKRMLPHLTSVHQREAKQQLAQTPLRKFYPGEPLTPRNNTDTIFSSPGGFHFGIKRNPYQRLFSAWKDKAFFLGPCRLHFTHLFECRKHADFVEFEDFVDYVVSTHSTEPHVCPSYFEALSHIPQIRWYDIAELPLWLADFRQHLSTQDAYQNTLPNALPCANESIPLGKAANYYSDVIANKVFQYYQQDFEFFGYDKDSWRGGDNKSQHPPKRAAALMDQWFIQRLVRKEYYIFGCIWHSSKPPFRQKQHHFFVQLYRVLYYKLSCMLSSLKQKIRTSFLCPVSKARSK